MIESLPPEHEASVLPSVLQPTLIKNFVLTMDSCCQFVLLAACLLRGLVLSLCKVVELGISSSFSITSAGTEAGLTT